MKIKYSETLGTRILFTGVSLTIVVFLISSIHLYGIINIMSSLNILSSFGSSISSFFEAIIGIIFLGIMAWIATMVLNKGQTIFLQARVQDKNKYKSE